MPEGAMTPADILTLSTTLGWINGYMAALEKERKVYSSDVAYDRWWEFIDHSCKKFPDYDLGRMVEALFLILPELSRQKHPH